jgi:ferredoxin
MAKYKILHYQEECIGCGACAAICPEFWEINEEGLAHLKGSTKTDGSFELEINSEDSKARIKETADACPAQIIKIKPAK